MAIPTGSLIKVSGPSVDGAIPVEADTNEYALQSALDTTNTTVSDKVSTQSLGYTATSSGDRTLPADPTFNELADVLNQLIVDLKANGSI